MNTNELRKLPEKFYLILASGERFEIGKLSHEAANEIDRLRNELNSRIVDQPKEEKVKKSKEK